jgi:hypothetical protein
MGRAPVLNGRRSLVIYNNQPNNGVGGGGGGRWRGDTTSFNACGMMFTLCYRRQIEQQKNENREIDGALDFDGFCWMGGRNNQPKVGRNDGIYFGETVCRAMTIEEEQ